MDFCLELFFGFTLHIVLFWSSQKNDDMMNPRGWKWFPVRDMPSKYMAKNEKKTSKPKPTSWSSKKLNCNISFGLWKKYVLVSWNETPLKNGIVTFLLAIYPSCLPMTFWDDDSWLRVSKHHHKNKVGIKSEKWCLIMRYDQLCWNMKVIYMYSWQYNQYINLHMSYIGNRAGPRRRTNFAAQILQL